MRKLISKITGLMLGLSLAAGVGAAVCSKKSEPVNAAGGTFNKITSVSDLTSGSKYLIVSAADNLAFDGSLSTIDATSNTKTVSISSNSITTTEDFYFTITAKSGGYSIKGSGGYYIGSTSANANEMKNGTSDSYTNTITWNSTNSCFVIRGTNSYLVYNSTSGQTRFRYFKPGTCGNGVGTGAYHCISLFKLNDGGDTKTDTSVTINNTKPIALSAGGSGEQLSVTTSPSGLSVSYSSSNSSVASVSNSGYITPGIAGSATITVSYAGSDTYKSSSDTVTVNVSVAEPSHVSGMTIAEIVAATSSETPTLIYEVEGYVTAWKSGSTDGSQYGNFYIADTYGDTTNHAYVYGANHGNGAVWNGSKYTFTNAKTFLTDPVTSQIVIGSWIRAEFIAFMYNGTTFEFQGEILEVSNEKTLTGIALSGSYPTHFEVNDTFSYSGLIVTASYDHGAPAVVTPTSVSAPNMATAGVKTVTVSYTEGEVTKTATYEITVSSVLVKWTISFLSNGGSGSMSSVEVIEGEDYTLPECSFIAPEGKVFDYWEVNGSETTVIENVQADCSATAIWKDAPSLISDVITPSVTGVTSSSYTTWSDKSVTSSAVYAGNSSKPTSGATLNSIQLRSGTSSGSNVHSGIVSTTSGGTLKEVQVVWNAGCAAGRVLDVYGKDTAYTNANDLYDSSLQGTQLGSITQGSTTLLSGFTGCKYVGVRSNNGALNIDSVTFIWEGEAPVIQTYTVTYDGNGGIGSVVDSNSPYNSGSLVTTLENTFVKEGYTFVKWNTESDGSGTSYEENDTFNISGNTILYAIWEENGGGGGSAIANRCYTLVTNSSQFVEGAKYLIVGSTDSNNYALSTTQNSNNRSKEEISVENSVATISSSAVQVVTFETGETEGSWAFNVGGEYLYAASSAKNYLRTQTTNDSNGEWLIVLGENGAATVTAQGSNTRNQLRYNSGDGLFSCYASGQRDVYFYRLDFELSLLSNVTCSGDAGTHSFPSGFTWNVDLKAIFDDLPSGERTTLASKEAAVGSGLERYDYIIGKYNKSGETDASKTDYVHFISGRSVKPIAGAPFVQSISATNSSTVIIVVVALTSITSIGVLLVIKRKRSLIK